MVSPGPLATHTSGARGFGPVLALLVSPRPPPARPLPARSGRVHPCTEVPVELVKALEIRAASGTAEKRYPARAPSATRRDAAYLGPRPTQSRPAPRRGLGLPKILPEQK